MARLFKDLDSCVYGYPGVLVTGEAGDKQAGHFVPDHFLDQGVALDENVGYYLVETVDQLAELGRIHALRQGGRAAYVGEEHG